MNLSPYLSPCLLSSTSLSFYLHILHRYPHLNNFPRGPSRGPGGVCERWDERDCEGAGYRQCPRAPCTGRGCGGRGPLSPGAVSTSHTCGNSFSCPEEWRYLIVHLLHSVLYETSPGSTVSDFEQAGTGTNRPIPSGDLHGMQSQLQSLFREERRERERRRDLLTADPYQGRGGGSRMTDSSVTASPDMFYSLNLNESFSEAATTRSEVSGERSMESSLCTTAASETAMSDSYTSSSTARTLRGKSPDSVHMGSYSEEGDLDSIALGGGSGLQQLMQQQSPGSRRRHRNSSGGKVGGGGRGEIAPHDVCKYSLTLSGITVAVLEANPAYTHPADRYRCRKSESTQTYSSLDSCGLDPMCYLSEVANVLRAGVNRREIQRQRENLAQALPLDHLL